MQRQRHVLAGRRVQRQRRVSRQLHVPVSHRRRLRRRTAAGDRLARSHAAQGNACTIDKCSVDETTKLKACTHTVGNAGAVCRPASDVCDLEETCTGMSATCPGDRVQPADVLCRDHAGDCDRTRAALAASTLTLRRHSGGAVRRRAQTVSSRQRARRRLRVSRRRRRLRHGRKVRRREHDVSECVRTALCSLNTATAGVRPTNCCQRLMCVVPRWATATWSNFATACRCSARATPLWKRAPSVVLRYCAWRQRCLTGAALLRRLASATCLSAAQATLRLAQSTRCTAPTTFVALHRPTNRATPPKSAWDTHRTAPRTVRCSLLLLLLLCFGSNRSMTFGAGAASPVHVCRPRAGECDVSELCDGVSKDCPPDAVEVAGVQCREASDLCDAPEVCDGACSRFDWRR